MQKLFRYLFLALIPLLVIRLLLFTSALPVHAQYADLQDDSPQNLAKYLTGSIEKGDLGESNDQSAQGAGFVQHMSGAIALQITGVQDKQGKQLKKGAFLPSGGQFIAMLYEQQPSSREYVADLLDSIGVPSVSHAYAQGTGYKAMSSFLPFWKVFRNLAYSLYIIIFVVVGIMIMLRTKVNAQTIITIQTALPNLLITLLLITFSYAIVGFMIDLMYFLVYFLVFLLSSPGINIISTPAKAIARLMNYSAWSVIFEGRNSIVSAVSLALGDILSGLGTGGLEALGTVVSWITPMYLVVAITLAVAMLKLMFALVKAYIMLLVQTITAPLQILLNAVPGSKAFSDWLKKTASYLIPFPVAAAMFIFSAVLIGDPTKSTVFGDVFKTGNANPFGINSGHEFYSSYGGAWKNGTGADTLWLPPFTLTGDTDFNQQDILALVGFIVFLMTPAAVKMAQEWLQVKESPYTAEAFSTLGLGVKGAMLGPNWLYSSHKQEEAARMQARYLSRAMQRNPLDSKSHPEPADKSGGVPSS